MFTSVTCNHKCYTATGLVDVILGWNTNGQHDINLNLSTRRMKSYDEKTLLYIGKECYLAFVQTNV